MRSCLDVVGSRQIEVMDDAVVVIQGPLDGASVNNAEIASDAFDLGPRRDGNSDKVCDHW